ncbi:purple acid phosphatase 22-like [Fagus crenata]
MEKLFPRAFSLLLTLFLFPYLQHSQGDSSRQPPRPLIFTTHNRSDSDPNSDHIRVSWITEAKHTQSIVEYGKAPGAYNSVSTGEHTSYKYFFYSSGKIHHVKIGPLEPSTTYYYRCGGSNPEFSFRTPPQEFPIEFAVVVFGWVGLAFSALHLRNWKSLHMELILNALEVGCPRFPLELSNLKSEQKGDLGQTEWTASTLAHVESDLSYADTQQPLWDSFGRLVEPYASRRPWMVTQGNHEIEIFPILHPHGFTAYNARWLMAHEESGSDSNLYYSFEVAGTHIIMLGSYAEFDKKSSQYKWLVADLAKIDRKKTPWVIVLLHAPWYNTNTAHQGEGDSMRKAMEELLYNARVDVVFAGHVHAYERFTRIYNNKETQCGPLYVTIGDGGNREGLALSFNSPPSPLSLFREASFGHGRLRILNQTHAHWSWHRNNDSNAVVADQVWLESLSSIKACWDLNDEL